MIKSEENINKKLRFTFSLVRRDEKIIRNNRNIFSNLTSHSFNLGSFISGFLTAFKKVDVASVSKIQSRANKELSYQ